MTGKIKDTDGAEAPGPRVGHPTLPLHASPTTSTHARTHARPPTMARRILLINGANLNLLGTREPHIYGTTTLADVVAAAQSQAQALGVELDVFQSNHEGAIVDRIQAAGGFGHLINWPAGAAPRSQLPRGDEELPRAAADGRADVIIINPGGFTHTSVVLRDALLGVNLPFIEVHVSQVHAREPWRHHSYFHDKATAVIAGLGAYGYTAAIEFAARHVQLKEREQKGV